MKNVEGAVVSAALDIAADYASLVADGTIRTRIYGLIADEHRRTVAMIEHMFGEALETRRPRMWRTLKLRDPGLRALHTFQIDVLREWRDRKHAADLAAVEEILPSVLLSLNAIASGLRTTG